MISKLKIIPLGGLGEIGKNMTAYEFGSDIIVVDCGMGFPDEDMYGIDIVLPDISYLKANADRIRGLILTHGHEDHIGAVPYVLKDLDIPIYTTPLTAALVELKLEEHDLLYNTQIFTKKAGSVFRLGCFTIEFIHVNHSIPDSVALAIGTPLGTVIHTGDFKIDVTPISGGMIDLVRLGQLGNDGVLALLSDSTNVEKPGHSDSERKVGESFNKLFRGCDKRIIITTFASNVHRLQQIVNVAAKYKRKVAITGRSMENVLRVATVLGYMDIPENVMVDIEQINKLPKNQVVIISTGSQGETMSALYRMAFSEHKQVRIDAGDRVIISASAIPGNENMISRVVDELFHKGAEVIYDRHTDLHVSGHASQEEIKLVHSLVRPKFFIPAHGETRMLYQHAELAHKLGVPFENIFILANGDIFEITKGSARVTGFTNGEAVLIDGSSKGEVDNTVLRERKLLSDDGVVSIALAVSARTGAMMAQPVVSAMGFLYDSEHQKVEAACRQHAANMVARTIASGKKLRDSVPQMQSQMRSFLYEKTKRRPVVMMNVIEVE